MSTAFFALSEWMNCPLILSLKTVYTRPFRSFNFWADIATVANIKHFMTRISAIDFGTSISFKWITWPTCKSIRSYLKSFKNFFEVRLGPNSDLDGYGHRRMILDRPIRTSIYPRLGFLALCKIEYLDSQMIHWCCNILRVTVSSCVDSSFCSASLRPPILPL